MSATDNKIRVSKWIPTVAIIAGLIIMINGVIWFKNYLADISPAPKRIVQQITLIVPPPPPKIDEPPPEPEIKNEISEPEPEDDVPEQAEPASADIGIDANGEGAGDGFGLVGKKGGRGLLDGSPFAWYEGLMASELQDQISKINELKSKAYNFRIKLRVGFDGKVEHIELVHSTGDQEKDKLLLATLSKFSRFSQMPPGKMPNVVDLRITSSI